MLFFAVELYATPGGILLLASRLLTSIRAVQVKSLAFLASFLFGPFLKRASESQLQVIVFRAICQPPKSVSMQYSIKQPFG